MKISKIRSIKKIPYKGKVYDLSFDKDNLFFSSSKDLSECHNTLISSVLIHNSPPDIDIDFETGSDVKTDEFLYNKYGKDCVFPVITFSTFNEKGCMKDVAKAFGQDAGFESDVFAVTKEMPKMFMKYEGDLKDWLRDYPNTKECSNRVKNWILDPKNKQIIEVTLRLQGQVRNLGKHAAGIVITPNSVWNSMPINVVKGIRVSGFQESGSGKDLSDLGILKLDRLNLTTLNVTSIICLFLGSKIQFLTLLEHSLVFG
jgi:DNA polymerase-3 subunit alpha